MPQLTHISTKKKPGSQAVVVILRSPVFDDLDSSDARHMAISESGLPNAAIDMGYSAGAYPIDDNEKEIADMFNPAIKVAGWQKEFHISATLN